VIQDEVSTRQLLWQWREDRREAAFEALFRRHYPAIYRLLYRMVGDEAQDLTQEVFMRLYDQPPREADTNLEAWLYRVATRLGYNATRAQRRWRGYRDRLAVRSGGEGWLDRPVDPAEEAERHDAQLRVRAALARLSRREASLLVLRYSGLRYREIAEVLGVAPSSVGTLLSRAERAFAQAYKEVAGSVVEGGAE
jgi:RNA polymerase sigma-70 factor (ECF subfamily)